MRLRHATPQEIRYACLNFHYAKSVPAAYVYAYSVFEDDGQWCGVILYSYGSNPQVGKQFGLFSGEVLELIRVALNGRQSHTSKAVSISLRMLHRDAPHVKMVISFADQEQGHMGTIYQASNWMYVGSVKGSRAYIVNGTRMHYKTVRQHGWKDNEAWLKSNVDQSAKAVSSGDKHKYLFFFDRRLRRSLEQHSKPYPKQDEK